jgi:cyanophycinase
MSIHLVGGGWAEDYDGEVYVDFLAEVAVRASASGRALPRVAVLLVSDGDGDAPDRSAQYREQLLRVALVEPVVTSVAEGELFTSAVLTDIDGLLIGGGLTPAYLDGVAPIVEEIRMLVADGLPYLGFSAGAAIAADTALIGGWMIGEIPVCAESASEDLEDVTVAQGLGLVDLAIDVHAAQWGTLTRLVAATEAGLVDGGIAIDEFTVLIVGDDSLRVVGTGSVWQVNQHDDGVLVSTLGA